MTCRAHYLVKCLLDEMDEEKYTEWERKFVWDIAEKLEKPGFHPTEAQEEKLEQIWIK